jgi:exonuclease VII large subunit
LRSRAFQAQIPATPVPTMRAVSATPPDDPNRPSGEESITASAERARAELHAEIERVRRGVEQMLDEQQAPLNSDLRRELDTMQEDLRRYVKTRLRKSQKQTNRRVNKLENRTATLEQRLDSIDAERRMTEWRIHSDTERMLDGLLQEVRAIADRLENAPHAR